MARKMKDSGIEWIGEIPEGWEVHRIKNHFLIISGSGFKPDYKVNPLVIFQFAKQAISAVLGTTFIRQPIILQRTSSSHSTFQSSQKAAFSLQKSVKLCEKTIVRFACAIVVSIITVKVLFQRKSLLSFHIISLPVST